MLDYVLFGLFMNSEITIDIASHNTSQSSQQWRPLGNQLHNVVNKTGNCHLLRQTPTGIQVIISFT